MADRMTEDLDGVLALKASAKSARDDEDWSEAIEDLQEAIDLLQRRLPEPPAPVPSWLAAELADIFRDRWQRREAVGPVADWGRPSPSPASVRGSV